MNFSFFEKFQKNLVGVNNENEIEVNKNMFLV